MQYIHKDFVSYMLAHVKRIVGYSDSHKSVSWSAVRFFVSSNSQSELEHFLSSVNVKGKATIMDNNVGVSLPKLFNQFIEENVDLDCWLVFCHQDIEFYEDLEKRLGGLNPYAVYGVIGAKGYTSIIGQIIEADNKKTGKYITKPVDVQTLDEVCLILHTRVCKEYGLRFSEQFQFHFYGADLCMTARQLGLKVRVLQVDCKHFSKTIFGLANKQGFLKAQELFRSKWINQLPIRTTTGIIV